MLEALHVQLRAEVSELCEKNQHLMRVLHENMAASQADREARRAALNLLEDAVAARESEGRENAERRRAEEELRTSEEKYRTLFESIDEGFCIIERLSATGSHRLDFRFVEANPAFAAQAGVDGVVGKTFRQVFPGEAEEWYWTLENVIETGESDPLRARAGDPGLGSSSSTRSAWETTGQGRAAVIFKDISQRKAAEAALIEADRRKDEFLATLAHELRNPLSPDQQFRSSSCG